MQFSGGLNARFVQCVTECTSRSAAFAVWAGEVAVISGSARVGETTALTVPVRCGAAGVRERVRMEREAAGVAREATCDGSLGTALRTPEHAGASC